MAMMLSAYCYLYARFLQDSDSSRYDVIFRRGYLGKLVVSPHTIILVYPQTMIG
jgi:hypothetical protein